MLECTAQKSPAKVKGLLSLAFKRNSSFFKGQTICFVVLARQEQNLTQGGMASFNSETSWEVGPGYCPHPMEEPSRGKTCPGSQSVWPLEAVKSRESNYRGLGHLGSTFSSTNYLLCKPV